jgi:hypothetical protein
MRFMGCPNRNIKYATQYAVLSPGGWFYSCGCGVTLAVIPGERKRESDCARGASDSVGADPGRAGSAILRASYYPTPSKEDTRVSDDCT